MMFAKIGYRAGSSDSGGQSAAGFGNYGKLPQLLQERFFTNCAKGDPVRSLCAFDLLIFVDGLLALIIL